MAELLKNVYDTSFVNQFASKIKREYNAFEVDKFVTSILDEQWEMLALKQRMRKITSTLGLFMPSNYDEAIEILLKVNESSSGFPYIILPDFVEIFGQAEKDWTISMLALQKFTTHSTAEYAVRPFIINNTDKMMKQMLQWAESENEHIRRLASEGCRPSLPWGQALTKFKQDPTPILPILHKLKADPSLYVRKSVANNINDISKTHPDLVIQLAKSWYGQHEYTNWIIRHGCRTLIKQAHPQILSLFGYGEIKVDQLNIKSAQISIKPNVVNIGEKTELTYRVDLHAKHEVRIRIEYGIYFVKALQKRSLKKFLLSDKNVVGHMTLEANRTHSWADLTTRKHYTGQHRIVLFVNGEEVAETVIMLN